MRLQLGAMDGARYPRFACGQSFGNVTVYVPELSIAAGDGKVMFWVVFPVMGPMTPGLT